MLIIAEFEEIESDSDAKIPAQDCDTQKEPENNIPDYILVKKYIQQDVDINKTTS